MSEQLRRQIQDLLAQAAGVQIPLLANNSYFVIFLISQSVDDRVVMVPVLSTGGASLMGSIPILRKSPFNMDF